MGNQILPFFAQHKLAVAVGLLACSASLFSFAGSPTNDENAGPKSQLGKEDLYNILVAEFSIQRGNYPQALKYYLKQAKIQKNAYLAERATQLAMQQKHYVDMLEAALIWEKIAPNDEQPHFFTSLAYAFNMQPNAALEHMRKVLQLKGETDFTRLVNLIPQGSPSEDFFIHELQQAAAEYPHSYDVSLALALLYQRHNQEKLALEYSKKTITNAGDNATAIEFAIRIYNKYGKIDEAIAAYQQAIANNPDNLELRQRFAQYVIQFNLSLAEEQFEYLLSKQPDNDYALLNLSLIDLENGKLDAAEEKLLTLKKNGRRLSSANLYLGEVYRLQKQFDKALAAYTQVTDPDEVETAQEKSIAIYIELGKFDQADKLIETALANTQNNSHIEHIQVLHAFSLEKQGNVVEAYQLLSKLIDKNPDSFELRYSRAMLAEAKNEIGQMETDLRHIISLDPDNALALNALGYTLADKTTRYREALDLIEQAQKLVPDDPAILDSLGWVLFRMGRFTESVRYLKHSLSMLPDAEVAAHLGEALWMSGMKEMC